jgi:hypothetical protein
MLFDKFMIVCFEEWNAFIGILKGEKGITNYTLCRGEIDVAKVVELNAKPECVNNYYVWQDTRIGVKSVSEMLVPLYCFAHNIVVGTQYYREGLLKDLIVTKYNISTITSYKQAKNEGIEPFIMRMGALDIYRLFNLCLNDKLPIGLKTMFTKIQYSTSVGAMIEINDADDFVSFYTFARSVDSKTPAVEPAPWEPDPDCYFSSDDEDMDVLVPNVLNVNVKGNACLIGLCSNSFCDAYNTLDSMFVSKVLKGLVLQGSVVDFVVGFELNSNVRNSIALDLVNCCKSLPSIMVMEIVRQCKMKLEITNRFDARMYCTLKSLRETLVMMIFTRRCEVVRLYKNAMRNWVLTNSG